MNATRVKAEAAAIDEAALPASYHDCRTFAERMVWMRRENRRRCEAAAARKAGTPAGGGGFELAPPAG